MDIIPIIVLISLVMSILAFIGITIINSYNNYQKCIVRISEAENNIDVLLDKLEEQLSRTIPVIKEIDSKFEDEKAIINLTKIKNKKLTNFALDKELNECRFALQELIDSSAVLLDNEQLIDIKYDITDAVNDLTAAKKYYNDYVVSYNKLIKCFPSNVVGKLWHYKLKDFYSNEKQEMFEILKKNQ